MSAAETMIVGRSSLLAREFASRHADVVVRAIGHAEVDDASRYEGARCVVNFAFARGLEQAAYEPALDVDLRIAKQAARLGIHYIMISSRRVYEARAQWNPTEDSPAAGLDAYGRNKSRIESELRSTLAAGLTVLRPGNVIAYEPVAGRRRFGAYLQHQLLAKGRIRLTVDPTARRDLVPVEFFCEVLRAAALQRIGGTFNVGTGKSTRVGDAVRWLMEGYGGGELQVDVTQPADEFQLDCTRLRQAFGLACGSDTLERSLREIGRRLAAGA